MQFAVYQTRAARHCRGTARLHMCRDSSGAVQAGALSIEPEMVGCRAHSAPHPGMPTCLLHHVLTEIFCRTHAGPQAGLDAAGVVDVVVLDV